MSRFISSIIIFIFLIEFASYGDEPDVSTYLNMVASGKLNEVKTMLPDLMVNYPNDPGVMLLTGVCIEDANKAMEFYFKIIQEHPESQWADDAYWRIVQYFAILGDTTRARDELTNFQQKYPTSQYLIPAYDVVRSSVGIARMKDKSHSNINSMMNSSLSSTNNTLNSSKKEVKVKDLSKETVKAPVMKMKEDNDYAELSEKKEENKDNPSKSIINEKMKSEESSGKEAEKIIPKKEEPKLESAKKEEPKPEITKNTEQIEDKAIKENPTNKKVELTKIIDEPKTGTFGLQVASYASREDADAEMKKYLRQRMRTEVKPRNTADGGVTYAVIIGNYSTRESAEAAKIIVTQQCNCEPEIFEK